MEMNSVKTSRYKKKIFFVSFCLYLKLVYITKETWEKTRVKVIIFDGKKWLNEKHIEKQLEHSNLPSVTLQYSSDHRKQRQELQDCVNKQPCRRFLKEDFAMQIIMDCRTTSAVNLRLD